MTTENWQYEIRQNKQAIKEKWQQLYSPYNLLLTATDHAINQTRYKTIKKIKYLYFDLDKYNSSDRYHNAVPKKLSNFISNSEIKSPVIIGTMVGRAGQRGTDISFWKYVSQVMKQVENTILLVIGLSKKEFEKAIPEELTSKRVFATGFISNYLDY